MACKFVYLFVPLPNVLQILPLLKYLQKLYHYLFNSGKQKSFLFSLTSKIVYLVKLNIPIIYSFFLPESTKYTVSPSVNPFFLHNVKMTAPGVGLSKVQHNIFDFGNSTAIESKSLKKMLLLETN